MDCNCSINIEEKYVEVNNSGWETIKAKKNETVKKDLKCCECNEIIPANTSHQYHCISNVDENENESDTFRTCKKCAEIRDCFFCSYIYSEMFEDIENELTSDLELDILEDFTPELRNHFFKYVDI